MVTTEEQTEVWCARIPHNQAGRSLVQGEVCDPLTSDANELARGRSRLAIRRLASRLLTCPEEGCKGRAFVDEQALAAHRLACHSAPKPPAVRRPEPSVDEQAEMLVADAIRSARSSVRGRYTGAVRPNPSAVRRLGAHLRLVSEVERLHRELSERKAQAEREGDGPAANALGFCVGTLRVQVKRLQSESPLGRMHVDELEAPEPAALNW